MAVPPQYLSLEEFERLYARRKPHYEYSQLVLEMLLLRRGWKVLSEVRLKISRMAEPLPDVVADRRMVGKEYPREAIDLCVEMVSPGDRLREAFAKAAHYLDWKIMSLEDPNPVEVGRAASLFAGSANNVIEIPMRELFEEIDRNFENR